MKKQVADCQKAEDTRFECRVKAALAKAMRDPELRKMFDEEPRRQKTVRSGRRRRS